MASSVKTRSPSALTGLRRGAFLGYRWLLAAFLLAGVVQIFLAGLGAFRLQDQGLSDGAFAPHRALGFTIAGIALLILVLAGLAENHTIYGGLHAFDGLLLLGIAGWLYVWSRRREA